MSLVKTAEQGIVWGIDNDNDAWMLKGGEITVEEIVRNTDSGWTEVKSVKDRMVKIAVGKDYRAFGIDSLGTIHYRSGTSSKVPTGTEWKSINDEAKAWKNIAACPNGDFWATKFDGTLWYRTGVNDDVHIGTGWEKCKHNPGGKVISIGCGYRGQLWGSTDKSRIFELKLQTEEQPQGTSILLHGKVAKSVEVGNQAALSVFFIENTGSVSLWYLDTTSTTDTKLNKVTFEANLQTISAGENQLWGSNKNHQIFKRLGINPGLPYGTGWAQVKGRVGDLSVGYGPVIWGVDYAGDIWFKAFGKKLKLSEDELVEKFWDNVSGALHYIDVGRDGAVWGTNSINAIYSRDGISKLKVAGTGWTKQNGAGTSIAVCTTGMVYVVGTDKRLYYRTEQTENDLIGKNWN